MGAPYVCSGELLHATGGVALDWVALDCTSMLLHSTPCADGLHSGAREKSIIPTVWGGEGLLASQNAVFRGAALGSESEFALR